MRLTQGYNDHRAYVIGDIHGRLDLLEELIEKIWRDFESHPGNALTVTLGDYIDRGPASSGVIDCLLRKPFPTRFVALKGNHEALLAGFLDNPLLAHQWFSNGGINTLGSYGVSVPNEIMQADLHDIAGKLRRAMPREHVRFLAELKLSLDFDRYFLCHAGVRPGVPLELQSDQDLMWIREEFLESRSDFGRIVVHGHTPTEWPEIHHNRINIDTGAYATGRLTCLILGEKDYRFLQSSSKR